MFEGMDMNALLAQAQQMQEQMLAARDSLAHQEFEAASGGDLVKVKVNGLGDLVDVTIAPEAWDPEDTDSLGALIVAAYRTARESAEQAASAAAPQIPGMGFCSSHSSLYRFSISSWLGVLLVFPGLPLAKASFAILGMCLKNSFSVTPLS